MSSGGSGTGGGSTGTGGSGNSATTVTITFYGSSMPLLVAAQTGSGALAAKTLSGNTLALSIPSGTSIYSVAYLCPALGTGQSSSQFEYLWEASVLDGTSVGLHCGYQPSPTPTLSGSLDASAIPGVNSFQINAQTSNSFNGGYVYNGPTASFDVPAPAGGDRVLVLANTSQADGPAAAKNFDNQTVPGALNGGNTVVFGTADSTIPEQITYNNVPSGFSSPSTYVTLSMNGAAQVFNYGSNATSQYLALPASATETGDAYFLDANASNANLPISVNTETISSGGPVSFTFPHPWNHANPTPAALPNFAMDYTGFSGKANVNQNAWISWKPQNVSSSGLQNIQVETTANYQSGSTTLAIPDLSGLAGYFAPPSSGTRVEWNIWMQQQSWSLTAQSPLNGTLNDVSDSGQYTVP
jgi:hypothetical protein